MDTRSTIHIFGEVLFDHFPDGSRVLGGAPFNVAWHLQAFGHHPSFISRIGNDASGKEIHTSMRNWGMDCGELQIDRTHATGSVQVTMKNGEPYYDIMTNSAYDFIDAGNLTDQSTSGILYHGSLAIRNPQSLSALQAMKAHHQGKIFVDVNLRSPWWHAETLLPLLQDADWVKLNKAELHQIVPNHTNMENAMQSICEQFALTAVFVTLGEQGAVAHTKDEGFIAARPPANLAIVDTVGAGDAFASILLIGLNENWPMPTTLERAQTFASEIVRKRGATVTDPTFYQRHKIQWL